MERFALILSIASLVLIAVVLRSVRRERIRVEHSVVWLTAGVAMLALSLIPGALNSAGEWLGIGEPVVAFLVAILLVFLGVFYRFSRVVSELKDMNITLIQRVAILEYQVTNKNGEDC